MRREDRHLGGVTRRPRQGGRDPHTPQHAAQKDLYQTEQQLIELRIARLTNLADLYTALGGGWRDRG